MQSTAKFVMSLVNDACFISLYAGYALGYDAQPINFDCATTSHEKWNAAGCCTYLVATYKDGSQLEYTYSENNGPRYSVMA